MPEDLYATLLRFHREVFLPDFDRLFANGLRRDITNLRKEMLAHFDAIDKRFDRLESECRALAASLLL